MAIRDKFRRAVGARKSTSSSSSSTHTSETASNTESDTASSTSSPIDVSNRSRTFAWRSAKGDDKQAPQQPKTAKKKSRWTMPDPREKPFTEMNLRYQQILGSYELSFGTSHPEQLWNPDGELSPGTSRQNSIDLGRD